MENILLENLNIQKLKLRAGEHIEKEVVLSLRGTKALVLETMSNTDKEYNEREDWGQLVIQANKRSSYSPIQQINVTTWSSLVRHAIDILKPNIDTVKKYITSEEFIYTFECCVKNICEEMDFNLNANCPRRLFKEAEETDLIHSSVYMNNKNHFIPILADEEGIVWGLCAVYTQEIVVMLEALLDTIHCIVEQFRADYVEKFPFHTIILTYINREDLVDDTHKTVEEELVEGIDNEIQNLELSKDLLQLQQKVIHLYSISMELNSDIEYIQKKYNLKTLDDLLNSME